MMAAAGKRRKHKRYMALYREGSPATCFYVLQSGTLHETALSGVDRVLTASGLPEAPFALFGMEALFGRPRASTIVAQSDVAVLKFSAVDLNIREDGAAKVARKVFNAFVEAELMHMALFAGVTPKQLKQANQRPPPESPHPAQ
jgi:CRP-like cAMP-binding protein